MKWQNPPPLSLSPRSGDPPFGPPAGGVPVGKPPHPRPRETLLRRRFPSNPPPLSFSGVVEKQSRVSLLFPLESWFRFWEGVGSVSGSFFSFLLPVSPGPRVEKTPFKGSRLTPSAPTPAPLVGKTPSCAPTAGPRSWRASS